MNGNTIDAQTALQYGLVNHVVPADQLLARATELLQTINTKAPVALALCIKSANAVYDKNGFEVELESFGHCFETNDMKEGTSAFLEKRKPQFTGR